MEENQDVSSQSTEVASNPVEPNDSGQPSPTMTDTQSSDYYNKTQQLAQQRREFESQQAEFEKQRQEFMSQYGQGAQYNQSQYGQTFQPQQAQQSQLPQGYQTYQELVNAVGEDAAKVLIGQQQQLATAASQQIQQLNQYVTNLEINSLLNTIENRGERQYGDAWKEKGQEVMGLIKQFPGMKLDMAWNAVNGANAKQAGIDEAYKNQAEKVNANVGSQQVQPQQTQKEINSLDDAMAAAMNELATA